MVVEFDLKRISGELESYLFENQDLSDETWFQYMRTAKMFVDKSLERSRIDSKKVK